MRLLPHKRRARAGGKGLIAGAVLCMMGLTLMVFGSFRIGGQSHEPNKEAHQLGRIQEARRVSLPASPAVAQPVLTLDISPERADALLADMTPLRLPTHGPIGVKTTLLCFCLHKGPETVRELRRLAAERFVQGVAAFENAKYQEAVNAFDQAIQRHPGEARAFVNRGLAYARLQRYQETKADLTQAIALDETLADAYYGRGLIAIFIGDHDAANADIRHAAQLGDDRARRLSQIGTLSVTEGS